MRALKATIVLICLVVLSCAGGGKYPPPVLVQADLSLKKFRDLFLQGRFCAAQDAFRTAVKKYASVDSPCDIAEAYLQRYLLDAYIGMHSEQYLKLAHEFARMDDSCGPERQRINQYQEGSLSTKPEGPLARSVTLRKRAIKDSDTQALKEALRIDRTMGWSALLWHDLKLLVQLSQGPDRARYEQRLKFLEDTLELQCLEVMNQ